MTTLITAAKETRNSSVVQQLSLRVKSHFCIHSSRIGLECDVKFTRRKTVTRRSKAVEQFNISMKRSINAALMLFLVFFDLCMLSFRSHHPQ